MKTNVKTTYTLAFWVLLCVNVSGQAIQVGQKMPNVAMPVENYVSDSIDFSKLRGKVVIIDFWGHYCTVCFASFPKINALQNQFADKVQIILVNRESKSKNDSFFRKRNKITKPTVPMIAGDRQLSKLFPHSGVPYSVWIDTAGTVRNMTEGYHINEKSINDFINGTRISANNFHKRVFVPSFFDRDKIHSLQYYSYISQCIDSIRLAPVPQNRNGQLLYACHSIYELYKAAYDENGKNDLIFNGIERAGRISLEVADTSVYKRPRRKEDIYGWESNHSYNYQLLLPESRKDEKYKIMQEDLKRFFSLDVKWEIRNLDCLVLTRTGSQEKWKTKGGDRYLSILAELFPSQALDSIRGGRNIEFQQDFFMGLRIYMEWNFNVPFIDATGISGNVDIGISGKALDEKDLDAINLDLKKHGLSIQRKKWPVNVLVLRESQ